VQLPFLIVCLAHQSGFAKTDQQAWDLQCATGRKDYCTSGKAQDMKENAFGADIKAIETWLADYDHRDVACNLRNRLSAWRERYHQAEGIILVWN
jgi:hypothetical protein